MFVKLGMLGGGIPSALGVLNGRKFDLHAVDAVDTVDEEDEDENKRNLVDICQWRAGVLRDNRLTFIPYCNFATTGLSDIKVKSRTRQVNGSGTMSAMKITISVTSIKNTCGRNQS